MAKESLPIIPIAIIGGIGYYLYKNGLLSSLTNLFSSSTTPATTSTTTVDPAIAIAAAAALAAATTKANVDATNVNLAYAAAVKSGSDAAIAQALKDAANAQVIIGNPRDPRTPINCLQPNIIKDGVCVDPFTLQPPTLSGLEGLGEALTNGLGCDCSPIKSVLGGLGQILDFGDFFTLQPHRRHITGNFR